MDMIGRGIATIGVWGGVGIVAVYSGGDVTGFVAFVASFATVAIWRGTWGQELRTPTKDDTEKEAS